MNELLSNRTRVVHDRLGSFTALLRIMYFAIVFQIRHQTCTIYERQISIIPLPVFALSHVRIITIYVIFAITRHVASYEW